MEWPLQFGLFLAPLHHPQQNPTRALRRDLELIVRAEELGYTEAWIGEHYSTGHEIIAGGDLFVAAAAERTKRIRLGPAPRRCRFTIRSLWPPGPCSSTT